MKKDYSNLPLLPLRDVVIYPNMVVPLFVGRDLSIKSLDDSMNNHDKSIVLVTQKSAEIIKRLVLTYFDGIQHSVILRAVFL